MRIKPGNSRCSKASIAPIQGCKQLPQRPLSVTIPLYLPLLILCSNGRMIKQITNSSVKAGNLRSLKLGTLTMEIVTGLATDEYPVSTTVEELSLGNSLSAESRIIDIVNLYPQLLRLDVSYTNITGVAVKHFVGMGVAWLRLDECPHVSPDAVEYARGKGVEVEFNFPSRRNLGFRDRVAAAR